MTDQDKKPKEDKTLDTVAKSLLVIWICIGIAFGVNMLIAFLYIVVLNVVSEQRIQQEKMSNSIFLINNLSG